MRGYLKTAAMQMTGGVDGGIALVLGTYLLRFLRVVVLLALWRVILSAKGGASGMSMDAVLTYTLISAAFEDQLSCRTDLSNDLDCGGITTRFLRPIGIFGQYASEMFGNWGLPFLLFSIPILIISPLLGVSPLPASLNSGLWFVVSLVFAISVGLAIEFIFSGLMVILGLNAHNTSRIKYAVSILLSGALIPLALLPWGLGQIFGWLPFAAMASTPLKIFTGSGNALLLIAMQVGWSVILWPIAYLLWGLGRERMVSYGG